MDYVLLKYYLNDTIAQLTALSKMIDYVTQFVNQQTQVQNYESGYWSGSTTTTVATQNPQFSLALANFIISLNNFCGTADEYISILNTFLTEYGANIRVDWPILEFPFVLN